MHSDLENLKQAYRCCVDKESKATTHLKCNNLIQKVQQTYKEIAYENIAMGTVIFEKQSIFHIIMMKIKQKNLRPPDPLHPLLLLSF